MVCVFARARTRERGGWGGGGGMGQGHRQTTCSLQVFKLETLGVRGKSGRCVPRCVSDPRLSVPSLCAFSATCEKSAPSRPKTPRGGECVVKAGGPGAT